MQILRRIAHWQVPLVFALVGVVAAAFGDFGRAILRYDRPAIADGEYWRLLTGHFVHLGYQHLLLNLAGLLLVWLLVGRHHNTRQWYAVSATCIAVMSLGFWILDADMRWYVGLSGLLHGLLLAGGISGIRSLPAESMVICAVVVGKLLYEQLAGPLPGSESVAGGTVIVNAHLYGAAGSALAAFFFWHRVRRPPSI